MRKDINQIAVLRKEIEELEEKKYKLYDEQGIDAPEKLDLKFYQEKIKPISEKIEAMEREIIAIRATNVNVGDGITLTLWSDRHSYTIIERKETPKGFKITIQRDKAIRTDKNGMSDWQDYEYERNENGETVVISWNPRKNWFSKPEGYRRVALGRREYYDYSF